MQRCHACSGAHNLAIAARLASHDALPDSMMLAASTGCCGRSARKLTRLSPGSDSPHVFIRPHRRCSARDKGDEPKNPRALSKPLRGVLLSMLVGTQFCRALEPNSNFCDTYKNGLFQRQKGSLTCPPVPSYG
jgi:hypothetical protein